MMSSFRSMLLCASGVTGLSVTPDFAAFAQMQPDAREVVVVTATRSAAPRGQAPLAIGVLDQAEIERLGAQHVSEALNRLPGVNLNRGNGAEHLTAIRSPVLTGSQGAGSFLYLEDGVPLRAAGFANINGLFEAADRLATRIEVVRGPGSAVYGSNALHGLVNVLTPDPETARNSVLLEAGSYGRAGLLASLAGQTDLGAGWLGLSLQHEDGWRHDASLDRRVLQVRLDGEAGLTDWSLRLSGVDLEQETATFVTGFKAYEDEALSRLNADPEAFRNAYALRAALHLERPLSETLSVQAVVFARRNDMRFRMHFVPSEALESTNHASIGVQSALVWRQDRSTVRVGLDLDLTDGALSEVQTRPTLGTFVQGVHYDYDVRALTSAVFAMADHKLTPRLRVDAGLRWETTHYDYDNAAPDGVVGRYLRLADRKDDFDTLAPHAGLTFQINDRLGLFGRAARGIRAPQTAELYRLQPGQGVEGIQSETLDSLETGLRLQPDWGPRIEVVGFVMQKDNVILRDADGFSVTGAKTRHHGVELEADWTLSDRLSIFSAVSWAVHEYDFNGGAPAGSERIVKGARIDTAPEWLSSVRVLWRPTERTWVEGEWSHMGEYYADAANTALYDGHDLFNVRAGLQISERVGLALAVRNIADERYAERADFAFGQYRYFPSEPRTLSASMRLTY